MMDLKARYEAIVAQVREAEMKAGREPGSTTIVAVSKTHPAGTLIDAYHIGIRDFGENRPEELAQKRQLLETELGTDNGITWHLIGPVQSRKAHFAAQYADLFHAVERVKIINRLANKLSELERNLDVLLEVNVSGEASKAGFKANNWENDTQQQGVLLNAVDLITQSPHLHLSGLMTMAPWGADPADIQHIFQRTRELAVWLSTRLPDTQLPVLSMGMTSDFELAIAEGATHVRIGRAIFGSRTYT